MLCPRCSQSNSMQAFFCMRCGLQLQTPPELQALADATDALRQAESAYWAAMREARQVGHNFRTLDKYSAHSYAHLSRLAKLGKF